MRTLVWGQIGERGGAGCGAGVDTLVGLLLKLRHETKQNEKKYACGAHEGGIFRGSGPLKVMSNDTGSHRPRTSAAFLVK